MPDSNVVDASSTSPAGNNGFAAPRTIHARCHACPIKPGCLPADLDSRQLTSFEYRALRLRRPLRAGQTLVRQGDAVEALYTIRVGSLKALIDEPNGTERIVGFHFPGTVIGLAEPEQRYWLRTFIALEDTWLCRIPLKVLDDAMRRRLIALMSERLQQAYRMHLTLACRSGPKRMAAFLLELSADFGARGLSASRFHLPMNYTDISNYLGMRHESVCRILGSMQELGLLSKSGKNIRILDMQALQHL